MENDSKQANQPAFEKLDGVVLWTQKKDIKALARISLALKSTCIQYVRTAKTAKAAWDALCGVFEDKDNANGIKICCCWQTCAFIEFPHNNTHPKTNSTLSVSEVLDPTRLAGCADKFHERQCRIENTKESA
ncbi:gag-polypeptide of LTR copia-type domain-containing protein [Phthorimaea operculella]|nr:gag-polypeptide of LTR copia-type domain-containing protein [Phthorimaea operculella]